MNGFSTTSPIARPKFSLEAWRPYAAVLLALAAAMAAVAALRAGGYPTPVAPWLLVPVLVGAFLGGWWGGVFAVGLGLVADGALFRELAFSRAAVPEAGSEFPAIWFLAGGLLVCLSGHGFRLAGLKSREARERQHSLDQEATRCRALEEALWQSRQTTDAQRAELEGTDAVAPLALATVDPELRFVRVNRRWSEISGQAPEAHLGRTVGAAMPLLGGALVYCLRRVLDTGEPVFGRELGSGPERVWLGNFVPAKEGDGRIAGIRIALLDITAQKRSEAALRESEEKFRLLAEGLPQGVWITDATGGTSFANRRGFELTELDSEAARGKGWLSAVHPQDRDRVVEEYLAALRDGVRLDTELRLRSGAGGDYRWHHLSAAPLRDWANWLMVAMDVDQPKAADRALRNLGERLRLSLEAGRMAAWVQTGPKAPADWLDPVNLLAAISLDGPLRDWIDTLPAASGTASEELQATGRDGEIRWVRAMARPLAESDGGGLAGVLADVTEYRQAEEALRRGREVLAEADRQKDEFLAVLTHELRNPLAPILTSAQLLRRRGLERPDLLESTTESIERQVKHLNRMIGDLSDLSRIGRGKLELKPEILELETVVSQAVEACRPLLDRHRQELFVDLPEQPLYVWGDPARLAQIISNLLGNASKFTPAGGNIHLTVASEGPEASLRVRDEGIGIDPAQVDRVFEPFVQLERPLHGGHIGLGVGLALVKRLAEMMGGEISASSEGKGKGSEFVIRLPLADAEVSQRAVAD